MDRDATSGHGRAEAARWLLRRRAEESTGEDADDLAFAEWLDRSESNRQDYAAVERAWQVAGSAGEHDAIAGWRQEALRYRAPARHRSQTQPSPGASRYRLAAIAAMLIAFVAIGLGSGVLTGLNPLRSTEDRALRTFATGIGERTLLTLDDGTTITLNSNSRIAIGSEPGARYARLLSGQALFEVESDPEHPFLVETEDYRVTVLGTVFDVRLGEDDTRVALAEGKVRFSPLHTNANEMRGAGEVTLKPGQQLIASTSGIAVASADVSGIMMWRSGRVQFRETPLPDAVAEMARYSKTPIAVDPEGLDGFRLTGTFKTANPEGFVTALTETFPVAAEEQGNRTVLQKR